MCMLPNFHLYFAHIQPWNKISLNLFDHRQTVSSCSLSMHSQVLPCQGHQIHVSARLKLVHIINTFKLKPGYLCGKLNS